MKRLKLILTIVLIMLFVTACGEASPQESDTSGIGNTNTTTDQPDASGTEGNDEQPNNDVPNAEQSVSGFDSRLAGSWYPYESNNNGDIKGVLNDILHDPICFLYDGTFFTHYELPFDDAYVIGGLEPLIISAENGKMDLGTKWLAYLVQNEAIEQADADKYSEISVTYEIFEITSEGAEQIAVTDSAAEDLSNYCEDGLRVHISGIYQKDPLTKQSIDFTYCYYKEYHNREFMEAYLVGNWEDDAGNKWNFTYQEGENSWPDFVYSMTDTNGTQYLSKQGYFLEYGRGVEALHEPNELGYILFRFESFLSPHYKVESMQANMLSLVSDNGSIILTRQ